MTQDQELLSFAAQLLEQQGSAVERHSDQILALLPAHISHTLKLPEEIRIGRNGEILLYGSSLLDSLVSMATEDIPVVYGELEVPYLKKSGFEQFLARDISFGKTQSRLIGTVEGRHSYMVLICRYLAMSDERKEGLVEVPLHEDTGAFIPELSGLWADFRPKFFSPLDVPPQYPVHIDDSISAAMKSARSLIEVELADFLKSMRRHLQRDVRNTREYYQALEREMKASLENPRLHDEQRSERRNKIQVLPAEMSRKIEDLQQKYQIHVTLTGCAALRLLVPVVLLTVAIRYSKLSREIRLIYNPVTRSVDPLVCEHCRTTTRAVYPLERDSVFYFYCHRCFRSKEIGGVPCKTMLRSK